MKAVLAWAGRLAPRVTRDDGVLPEPAKAVLDVFGKVRNRVHRVALDHGLLGAVVAARADEIDVADVEHELGSALAKVGLLRDLKPMRGGDAYTVEDVSAILRLTARGQGVHWITGEGLLESADAWDAKLQDPAWNTARRMKAPPAVPAAVGSSAYDQQLQERAQAEWDRGRAGALPTEKFFQLDTTPDGKGGDLRRFTYERWMRYRVQSLREGSEPRTDALGLHDPLAM
jgi:hypothetical protein